MAGYRKEELRREFEVSQMMDRVRRGEGVLQDFTYISNQDIAELKQGGKRLAADGEAAELLYLDDKRCVRVCTIETPAQITVAVADTRRGPAQSPAPATTPQRQRVAVPIPARA